MTCTPSPSADGDTAVMIFRFDKPDAAIELLQSARIDELEARRFPGP